MKTPYQISKSIDYALGLNLMVWFDRDGVPNSELRLSLRAKGLFLIAPNSYFEM